jgi:alginate O-acetyltransferase complex protein AlgI
MLFNSLQFLLYFIIVTSLYFALPHKRRYLLLLLASCWFYMAFIPIYILILFFTIIIDYAAGILIEKAEGRKRKIYLIVSIISNIGILCLFKYYGFFTGLLPGFMKAHLPLLNIILPIGLSFHTFQALSYTIEVYRGNQKAERHFGIYALYVMFYPQLVAGPIERPQNMLHQFREKYEYNKEQVREGLMMMAWGLLKKIVIADRLALLVDSVYDHPAGQSSAAFIIATVLFAFQIYCDFSAYSEIAFGAAHVMGFKLMENFRSPYFSVNISEFWSRWHISLSSWFRDYVYIPLGGNRAKTGRVYFNLFFVFLLSGLWHGADWGFVIWGALHGMFLIFAMLRKRFLPNARTLPASLNMLIVFVLNCVAWIFFRSASLGKSVIVLKTLAKGTWGLGPINAVELFYCMLLIVFLMWRESVVNPYKIKTGKFYLRMGIIGLVIYFLGIFGENQFIYFQF